MHRCFSATVGNYRNLRMALDAALELPAGLTTLAPLETALRDSDGAVLVAIAQHLHQMNAVAEVLGQFVAAGHAVEISEAEYDQNVVHSVPQ